MRLKYSILWFEDDEEFVKTIKPQVEDFLSNELGFIPLLTHATNSDDADKLLASGDYDLVVTDLNLGDGKHGEKIIEKMRTNAILTEVLLYSSAGAELTKVIAAHPGLERASFASGRPNLTDRLKKVIELTIRKVQDVNNMRGLVIAEAIDVEMKTREILLKHYGGKAGAGKIEEIKKKHVDNLTKHLAKVEKYDDGKMIEFINEVLTFAELNDSLISLVNDILAKVNAKLNGAKRGTPIYTKKAQLDKLRSELIAMGKGLVQLRNVMAHAKESKDGKGQAILQSINKSGKTVTFSDKDCADMRKNILKHFKSIEEISKHL